MFQGQACIVITIRGSLLSRHSFIGYSLPSRTRPTQEGSRPRRRRGRCQSLRPPLQLLRMTPLSLDVSGGASDTIPIAVAWALLRCETMHQHNCGNFFGKTEAVRQLGQQLESSASPVAPWGSSMCLFSSWWAFLGRSRHWSMVATGENSRLHCAMKAGDRRSYRRRASAGGAFKSNLRIDRVSIRSSMPSWPGLAQPWPAGPPLNPDPSSIPHRTIRPPCWWCSAQFSCCGARVGCRIGRYSSQKERLLVTLWSADCCLQTTRKKYAKKSLTKRALLRTSLSPVGCNNSRMCG